MKEDNKEILEEYIEDFSEKNSFKKILIWIKRALIILLMVSTVVFGIFYKIKFL